MPIVHALDMINYIWEWLAYKPVWNSSSIMSLIMMYLPLQKVLDSMAIDFILRTIRFWADLFMEVIGLIHLPKRNRLPPVTNPLLLQSATELTTRIRTGELKSETLVRAYIRRVQEVNGLLNAMVNDRFQDAIDEAKALDKRIEQALRNRQTTDKVLELPLLGIPISIKESIAVKGQPCSAGLYSRRNVRMSEDAPSVQNIRNAGAIIIGVTNVPEFLLWWDTNNRLYGRTNNPYDLSRISGGSSGGEASLISAAGSLIGLGSDIGGSIRIPSFFCGVFGHKPSSNVTSNKACYPYCGHPDREKYLVVGPICRYAIDLKLVFKQILLDEAVPLLQLDKPVELNKCKFYFLTSDQDPFKTKVSPAVHDAIVRARNYLEKVQNYSCQDIHLPTLRYSFYMWLLTLGDVDAPKLACEVTERKGELNGWLELAKCLTIGSKFRKITCMNVILENMVYSQNSRKWRIFRQTVNKGKELKEQLNQILDNDGILILPTLPEKPPKHNGTFLRMNNCGYTAIFNIMEMPVTHVTLGLDPKTQMPVGFQIVAKRLNDRLTIATAELLSKEFGGWKPPFEVKIN